MTNAWRVYCKKNCYFTLSFYFFAVLFTFTLSIRQAYTHAWRGQEVVLFISYDLSSEQVRATLGMPLALIQANEVSQATRKRLDLAQLSKQILSDQFLMTLQDSIKKDLPLLAQNQNYIPQIQKIDCIFNDPNLAKNSKQRFLRTWKDVEIESHSGTQDALVISLTYPLKTPAQLDKIHFFWKSKDWFVKSRSKKQATKVNAPLSTRKALGLIIDPQQITPLTFSPQEPEVIWRSPTARRLSTIKSKPKQDLHQQAQHSNSWWQSFKAYFTSARKGTKSDIGQLFKNTHRSIYRAFDLESDEKIYQALGQALHGSVLDQVFQSTYDALILRGEGGARAKVTHVIPLELELVKESDLPQNLKKKLQIFKSKPTYFFKYHWRISGLVEHWGHTHRRVNDYQAFYSFAYFNEPKQASAMWKIIALSPISQRRRPELEGGL